MKINLAKRNDRTREGVSSGGSNACFTYRSVGSLLSCMLPVAAVDFDVYAEDDVEEVLDDGDLLVFGSDVLEEKVAKISAGCSFPGADLGENFYPENFSGKSYFPRDYFFGADRGGVRGRRGEGGKIICGTGKKKRGKTSEGCGKMLLKVKFKFFLDRFYTLEITSPGSLRQPSSNSSRRPSSPSSLLGQ